MDEQQYLKAVEQLNAITGTENVWWTLGVGFLHDQDKGGFDVLAWWDARDENGEIISKETTQVECAIGESCTCSQMDIGLFKATEFAVESLLEATETEFELKARKLKSVPSKKFIEIDGKRYELVEVK